MPGSGIIYLLRQTNGLRLQISPKRGKSSHESGSSARGVLLYLKIFGTCRSRSEATNNTNKLPSRMKSSQSHKKPLKVKNESLPALVTVVVEDQWILFQHWLEGLRSDSRPPFCHQSLILVEITPKSIVILLYSLKS